MKKEPIPDAIVIRNERLPLWARWSMGGSMAILAVFATFWAIYGKMDRIVTANGKLTSESPAITLKALDTSVILDVKIKAGDVVKKDQELFTFDTTIYKAEMERLAKQIEILDARYRRLKAEFDQSPYRADLSVEPQMWQNAIFQQRQKYYQEYLRYYDESIARLKSQYKSREDNLQTQRGQLEAIKRIEKMFQDLQKTRSSSKLELLQVQISRVERESSVEEQQNALVTLEHQIYSTEAQKQSFIQEWRKAISEEMVSVELALDADRKSYEKNENRKSNLVIKSPCEAVVNEMANFSNGSAVREAEALVTLIPLDSPIEMEAELAPEDIGKVKPGDKARVKLNAYPYQKHGTLEGVVRNISEDTLSRDIGGGVKQSYYRARITVSGKLSGVGKNFRLIPGMDGSVEINAGKTTLIEKIFDPIIKALDESGKEP
ncbi:MAG: HlyD family type I secretion periplasmic adaptor subunit [Lentisphaeria bacterium]|nr:HlyD family type I secretion periplasmic adaptor subunit [Lentisphaeria bacterium]